MTRVRNIMGLAFVALLVVLVSAALIERGSDKLAAGTAQKWTVFVAGAKPVNVEGYFVEVKGCQQLVGKPTMRFCGIPYLAVEAGTTMTAQPAPSPEAPK